MDIKVLPLSYDSGLIAYGYNFERYLRDTGDGEIVKSRSRYPVT